MNPGFLNPLRWRRPFLLSLLLLMLVAWFGFIDTYSVRTRILLNKEKQELITDTERLQEETAKLQKKMEDLQADPGLLERLAREEFGMRKPGETIYRVIEE
ncbi:MAG: septum formation initiator family protein [Cyclonatronaceae bacterium]